jgi:hypothetical protein
MALLQSTGNKENQAPAALPKPPSQPITKNRTGEASYQPTLGEPSLPQSSRQNCQTTGGV